MSVTIIIVLCSLLLIAYLFDLTASKTRVPSVILLLLTGWIVRQAVQAMDLEIPSLSPLLPVFGTIGLVLIVLEGSLDLELSRTKSALIRKSLLMSVIPMMLLMAGFGWAIHEVNQVSWKISLTNVIPLCIISSAIAIPSAAGLAKDQREFVIYESSMSDIIGVMAFNFLTLNATIEWISFGNLFLQIIIMTAISFLATLLLTFFLHKIDHHIKFAPIILMVILIYFIAKHYHLPGLIFILLFGLFLGNIDKLKRFKKLEHFDFDHTSREVHKFKEIGAEGAFLIRALFFMIFGFQIETSDILNTNTLLWSASITAAIYLTRGIQLRLSGLPVFPLICFAPRGLITILLFLSIAPEELNTVVNNSMIIQVILMTAIIMMLGLMTSKPERDEAI